MAESLKAVATVRRTEPQLSATTSDSRIRSAAARVCRALRSSHTQPRAPAPPRKGASSPAPAAPSPLRPNHECASLAQQCARRQSQCTHANRSPECAPLPAPRRPRNSRAASQAHPDTRRTFHEPRGPPGNDAERVWQDRAIQNPVLAPTPQSLPRAHRAPRQPLPARPHPSQAPREPVQQRASRQSPCTHTNRSPECVPAPPYAAHSCAEPEMPRRSAGALQTRAAPSKSRPERVGSARARGTQVPSPS
jgi:hypothetical protein